MAEPKILFWDIETSHNIVATFQLKTRYIQPENILQERHLICAAWKWLGDKKVSAVSLLDNPALYALDPHSDLYILEELHKVLSEADVIVAHNGDKFDIRFVETRMIMHGLPPLPPIASIDTLKVARKRFLFNANKLDYLGKVLGVGRKKSTGGGALWLDILAGKEEAIKKMVSYNKQDVKLLEKVYLKLLPYIDGPLLKLTGEVDACPRCGEKRLQSRGVHRTVSRVYQRMHCQGCGGWSRKIRAEKVELEARPLA